MATWPHMEATAAAAAAHVAGAGRKVRGKDECELGLAAEGGVGVSG